AEDGIRDFHVTGVQTCALPIFPVVRAQAAGNNEVCPGGTTEFIVNTNPDTITYTYAWSGPGGFTGNAASTGTVSAPGFYYVTIRSEERRVGKECVECRLETRIN